MKQDSQNKIDFMQFFLLLISMFILFIDIVYYTQSIDKIPVITEQIKTLIISLHNKNYLHIYSLKLVSLLILTIVSLSNKVKKSTEIKKNTSMFILVISLFLFGFLIYFSLYASDNFLKTIIYIILMIIMYLSYFIGLNHLRRQLSSALGKDRFNDEQEKFEQTKKKIENEYSINLKTEDGWVNVVNPFRGAMVLGTPGSGKSYAVVEPWMEQTLQKQYSMLVYDYKFPDLSNVAYNYLKKYANKYQEAPKFYVINFDDPERSHRCNPLGSKNILTKDDATESASTLFKNLNKEYLKKVGFFEGSAVTLTAAVIYYFKLYGNEKLFTLPHVVEFISRPDTTIFPILIKYPELKSILIPFVDALEKEAFDQLTGQTGSTRLELSKLSSKEMYWILSEDEVDLRINLKEAPAVLCIGNNPERQQTYAAPIGLIVSNLLKKINKKGRNPSTLIFDELPTIYVNGLDNLMATARSNKVAALLSFQDLAQLNRDYGKEIADVIFNICGNIFSGSVKSNTAKALQDMFGKVKQIKESISITKESTNKTVSEQRDFLIPQDKITKLSQGKFVGMIADNFGQEIEQKVFNSTILVDKSTLGKEEIPKLRNFKNGVEDTLTRNYNKIIKEIDDLIEEENKNI